MNNVQFIGYATDKPKFKEVEGVESARFSIGITTKVGADKDESLFITCRIVGKRARIACAVIDKGSRLFVCGRLSCTSWDDKQTGQKRTLYYAYIQDIQYLDDLTISRLKEIAKQKQKDWKY